MGILAQLVDDGAVTFPGPEIWGWGALLAKAVPPKATNSKRQTATGTISSLRRMSLSIWIPFCDLQLYTLGDQPRRASGLSGRVKSPPSQLSISQPVLI